MLGRNMQLETSKLALQSGEIAKAVRYYSGAKNAAPDDLRTDLWGVFLQCAAQEGVSDEYSVRLATGLSIAPDSGGILQYLTVLVEQAPSLTCRGLNFNRLEEWLLAYRSSPETKRKTDYRVGVLLGLNAINAEAPERALAYFRESVWGLGQVNSGMLAVSRLAAASYYEEAQMLLEEVAVSFAEGALKGDDVDYDHEIGRLREMLKND